MKSLYVVPNDYNFRDPACEGREYICFPSLALSGIEVYAAGAHGIPGWSNSILAASLKKGTLYRLRLSDDGRSIPGDIIPLFRTTNQYRDLAIAPDKQTIYIATDKGDAAGPDGGWTEVLDNPGAILEFNTMRQRRACNESGTQYGDGCFASNLGAAAWRPSNGLFLLERKS